MARKPVVYGKNKGLGVYKDSSGLLNYKRTGSKMRGWGPEAAADAAKTYRGNPGVRGTAGPPTNNPKGKPSGGPQKPPGAGGGAVSGPLGTEIGDIGNYNLAAAGLLKGIGGDIRKGYGESADAIASYGQGFTGGVRDDLTQQWQGVSDSIRQATGNYLAPNTYEALKGAANPVELANAAYGAGAYLPARALQESGAAFGAAADFLPGARLQEGAYQINAAQAADREARAKVSAKNAELKIKQQQWKQEFELKQQKLKVDIAKAKASGDLARLKFLQQQQNQEYDNYIAGEGLKLRRTKQAADLKAALAEGRRIDSAASKVRGFIVDKQGRFITDKAGKKIPVSKAATAASAGNAPYQKAVAAASDLRGNPVKNDSALARGSYVAAPSAKGVFIDGTRRTTNDPKKALYDTPYSFKEAVGILMERYGVTKAQARKALITIGWKPTTKPAPPANPAADYPGRN